jgi:hypothetical protein
MKTKILKGTKEQFSRLLLKSLDYKTEDLPTANKLKSWTVYREDFSEDSLEYEVLFKKGKLREIQMYYE